MKLLIDAEYYLYRAAAGCEIEVEWQPDDWTYVCRHGDAKAAFQDKIAELREIAPDHEPVLAFGDRASFRYGVWPAYKANRRSYRRPAGYRHLTQWVSTVAETRGWRCITAPDVEGDDVLGIHCLPGDIIAAQDKDLMTIPGLHLRDGEVFEVSELEADRSFYGQVLTGDSADGYPGCPGIGAARAAAALDPCQSPSEMWQVVLSLYGKAKLGERDAITQARCARILRVGEYDHDAGTPLLWSPPVACV